MKSCIMECRTVAIVRDFKVEQRQGANGTFEAKDILFRIAVDRDYKVTRTENGKTIQEYPTDFWLCKATGAVAEIFAKNCTATKEDGKLQSRHLLVSGSFENYTNTRKVKVAPQVNIGGQVYQLDLEVDVPNNNNTIFIVDSIRFLDSNPANANKANGSTTVTTASVTPVVAQPAPAVQPVAPQTAPIAQPVVAQSAPVVQATAPASTGVETAMNPPVVGNFDNTGAVAPF